MTALQLFWTFVYFLIPTANSLSSVSIYDCNFNETCIINCSSAINATQCTNLTINAKNASSLKVTCQNSTYCENMNIICPYCADCWELNAPHCDINCIGDRVCPHIKINSNKSFSLIKCSGNDSCNFMKLKTTKSVAVISCSSTNQTTCSHTHINSYSTQIYFVCDANTSCNSIQLEDTGNYSQINLLNSGYMDQFNLIAPDAHQLSFIYNGVNGIYSNSLIKNKSPYIQGVSFINSEFHVNSMRFLLIAVTNSLIFMNNTVYCTSDAYFEFENAVQVSYNEFYINNNGSLSIDLYTMFKFNTIYANDSSLISIHASGRNTEMSDNQIFAEHGSNIEVKPDDYSVKIYNNSIYANDADSLTLNIFGGLFVNNQIYARNVNNFILYCAYSTSKCGSLSDTFMISNATSVSIKAGAGGQIIGGTFHVQNVSHLSIISDFGFIANVNVNAMYAENISVIMTEGSLYNSIINGSQSKVMSVNCYSTNYWTDLNHTNCNGLTLVTSEKEKMSLLCDGYGCEQLTLYTVNGADDINVTGIHCDCNEDIVTDCIGEWEIYCKKNNYSSPSILSTAKKCDGVCCDNVVDDLHISECKWSTNESKFKVIYVLIPIIIVAVLFGTLIKWCAVSKYAEDKSKEEPLLVQ